MSIVLTNFEIMVNFLIQSLNVQNKKFRTLKIASNIK